MSDRETLTKPVDLFPIENRCKDFDEDCNGLNHTKCWLYDPEQGWCPFLQTKDQSNDHR